MNMDYDFLFKVIMLGSSGVGKSSMLNRYIHNSFDSREKATIGVDFRSKTDTGMTHSTKCHLSIWDTAGQEVYFSMTRSYYRGSHAVIFMYDIANESSFKMLNTWVRETEQYMTIPDAVFVVVGNKCDQDECRKVSTIAGAAFAQSINALFLETSAKTGVGIVRVFRTLLDAALARPSLCQLAHSRPMPLLVVGGEPQESQVCCM